MQPSLHVFMLMALLDLVVHLPFSVSQHTLKRFSNSAPSEIVVAQGCDRKHAHAPRGRKKHLELLLRLKSRRYFQVSEQRFKHLKRLLQRESQVSESTVHLAPGLIHTADSDHHPCMVVLMHLVYLSAVATLMQTVLLMTCHVVRSVPSSLEGSGSQSARSSGGQVSVSSSSSNASLNVACSQASAGTHHPSDNEDDNPPPPPQDAGHGLPSPAEFVCPFCSWKSNAREDMEDHIILEHPDELAGEHNAAHPLQDRVPRSSASAGYVCDELAVGNLCLVSV